MEVFRLLLFTAVTTSCVNTERILAITPLSSKSHFIAFQCVFEELAKRGHEVTVLSVFPKAAPQDRYIDFDVSDILGGKTVMLNLTEHDSFGANSENFKDSFFNEIRSFENVYQDKRFEKLLNKTKFDLVITELFFTDIFIGLSYKLKIPLIEMMSSAITPWSTERFGIPNNPSYIRLIGSKGSGPMSIYERIVNVYKLFYMNFFYEFTVTRKDDAAVKRYLGDDAPHIKELMSKASLCLVNSHFSINGARPLPPQVVEIGGVHVKPAKALPQEIEQFISESVHGVVYFSLGSVANGSSMTAQMSKAFCNSFAKLKQRVLWKWELDDLPGKPENVKIVKWMPQGDVLAHPNVRVFMSHGGLLGTIEAVHHAVPVIGIPLLGDQYQNIANLVNEGAGVLLDLSDISELTVSKALNTILADDTYKKNVQHLSQLFRDRPLPALDTAIYWIEYVLKHNGAHHLRTAAVGMPWYQYYLLDVLAVVVSSLILVIYVLIFAVKYVFRKVCGKSKEKVH